MPLRLYILEITGLGLALMTLVGLVAALVRRVTVPKVAGVTTLADWLLLAMLLTQVVTGIAVAVMHPWGSSWFAADASPYLWSIFKLSPQINYIAPLPVMVKLHVLGAWLLIGFFPFTRLVHLLVIPNPYLWRKPQVVRWYRKPAGVRS